MDLDHGLRGKDLHIGEGEAAYCGQIVMVHYQVLLPNGEILLDSKGKTPNQFKLGGRSTFAAQDYGVRGMRCGGIRLVEAPPKLTYYEQAWHNFSERATLTHKIHLISISETWDKTFMGTLEF